MAKIRHVLRSQQFGPALLRDLFTVADKMEDIWRKGGDKTLFEGCWAVNLFCQPSTRTHTSHRIAEIMGDMEIIYDSEQASQYSSISKGEDWPDTVRTFESMVPDPRKLVIVIRHSESETADIMAKAANGSHIINAGCGKSTGQHPTQSLLDLWTIFRYGRQKRVIDINTISQPKRHQGRKPFNVLMLGDLRNGRTVRSLSYLLPKCMPWVNIYYCSPPSLKMGEDILAYLKRHDIPFHIFTDPHDFRRLVSRMNVFYCTRFQYEDLGEEDRIHFQDYQKTFRVDRSLTREMKPDTLIMHPFPRNREIARSVDRDPRAVYFEMVRNGVIIRMGLLAMLLGRT